MKSMDRRTFVAGAAIGAIAASSAAIAVAEEAPEGAEYEIAETLECDILVVGSGTAGLCAAVNSADGGASVIVLERAGVFGGGGPGTDGPSGFDTRWSKAAGVEYDYRDAGIEEQRAFNYITDNNYYRDMAKASGDNIEWCAAHGVPISDVVDKFKGGHPTAHHWGEMGGKADPELGRINYGYEYVNVMIECAEELGVQMFANTPAIDIVMDGERFAGVIAQREDGSYIQVNAKATIIGTGGMGGSPEFRAKLGRPDDVVCEYLGTATNLGDGYVLATKAGAYDLFRNVGWVEQPGFVELGYATRWAQEQGLGKDFLPHSNDEHPIWNIIKKGNCIWVNDRGERFANEDAAYVDDGIPGWAINSFYAQKKAFAMFDQAVADLMGEQCMEFLMTANEHNTKFTGETLEELAENMGIPADTLKKTVEDYNALVDAGEDLDFGKRPDALHHIGDGPYYATQLGSQPLCTLGGVRVTREMEAADVNWNVIPGLYVIGNDSFPFYTQMYYFKLPGSAVAYCLHSALTASRNALAKL